MFDVIMVFFFVVFFSLNSKLTPLEKNEINNSDRHKFHDTSLVKGHPVHQLADYLAVMGIHSFKGSKRPLKKSPLCHLQVKGKLNV